ncbi:GNAT family N-acetyltransferase [Agreia sp.]|uniref:GNAT family N-acetyltransferase n=1 Tax=Agreia sp. TaxID=1872416 RepID=UPI0035BBEE81
MDESTSVVYRRANPTDAPGMERVAHAAYEIYVDRIGRPPAPMAADYARIVSQADARVALVDGAVAGLMVLAPSRDHLLIENVAVLPSAQGRGIGLNLLGLAEQRAAALKLHELRLYTNEAMFENLAFYARRGYTETHRATVDGYRRVYFTKQLSAL